MPTEVLGTTQTTFVSSAQSNNNFSFYPLMYVGFDPSFQNTIGFIKFNLPSLPGVTVDSAYLKLSVIVKTGAAPSPIVVNRVTMPLDTSTVTYNSMPNFVATPTQVDVTTADLYSAVQFDVTELVSQWLDGTFPNEGMALTNPDGVTLVQFATNNIVYQPYFPQLIINYSSGPTPGTLGGIQAQLQGSPATVIEDDAAVIFDTVITNQIPTIISYDNQTGEFTIDSEGRFYASWWVATDGSDGPVNIVFAVSYDDEQFIKGNMPIITGQVSGEYLFEVGEAPAVIKLVNQTGASVLYANIDVQANISVIRLSDNPTPQL